jgi:hypothetical protein
LQRFLAHLGLNFVQRGALMTNLWTKKNPLLSIWMSAANAVIGAARGRATAQAKRQASAWMRQSTDQMTRWWTDPLGSAPRKRKRKKRR